MTSKSKGKPVVSYYCNMTYFIPASLIYKGFKATAITTSGSVVRTSLVSSGMDENLAGSLLQPIVAQEHPIGNPWISYNIYLTNSFVPGLLALLIMLTTCFSIWEEIKKGRSRQWLAVANGSMTVAVVGKLLPQTIIFSVVGVFVQSLFYGYYHLPMNGSILAMISAMILFVNGEINTIRGNIDRMLAREETIVSPIMKDGDLDKIFPVVHKSGSDSAMLDNTLEFMYMNGIDLPLAVMMTIPEPWKHNHFMEENKKDFYHYYATMMEPWDGPAAILFTDGDVLGATLDRNGLRPSRYYITDDKRLILSSEVGVLDIAPEHIVKKSRLQPGKILLVDTKEKRIISDEECKNYYASRQPYGEWIDRNLLHLGELTVPNKKIPTHSQEMRDKLYKAFGYTYEDVKNGILPMAANGIEATASMGHDVPLAVLSEKHQLLFSYFKQLFAQVTNPPIDSLREEIVTDTTVYIGSDGNLLQEKSENCRVLEVNNPILTGVDLLKIKTLDQPGFKAETISLLYYNNTSLKKALEQLSISVDRAYSKGSNIIILSDRGIDENHVAIPSLLAISSVEQHLVRTKKRTAISLILESGEPRDVHQMATLLGFGARAINPYLAHECIAELIDIGILDKDYHTAIKDYNFAILHGIVKTAAKMGISTLQSYQSARIFEAIGLSKEVIDDYFTGTVSRVGGIGLAEIEEGIKFRHDHAFDPMGLVTDTTLDSTGFHKLRSGNDKEDHLYNPQTIIALQQATQSGSYERFREYTDIVDNEKPHTLRGLLEFVPVKKPVPLDQVEPARTDQQHSIADYHWYSD